MAVAHSAASESHTGTSGSTNQTAFSWTHTQTGTPQGVLVFVHVANSTGNPVSTVTYGSVTLTRVSGGAAIDSAGEAGRTDLFFAGSGLASGNQTITVNRSNTADIMYASAATVTAATDTNVTGIVLLQGDGTLTVQSVTDGGAPTNSLRYAGAYSGLASPPPAGTGSTLLNSIDFGNYGIALVRETTAGTGARNVGFNNATTDDRAAVHVAVRELWNRSDTAVVGAFTLTGNDVTLTKPSLKEIAAEVGGFTLTGQPADLRHNINIIAASNSFSIPAKNEFKGSNDVGGSAWVRSSVTTTSGTIQAPDGTQAGNTLTGTTSTAGVGNSVFISQGISYTLSCYFKSTGTNNARLDLSANYFGTLKRGTFNLSAGTGSYSSGATGAITNVGDGWYRCEITATATASTAIASTASWTQIGVDGGIGSVYAWGGQLEESSAATALEVTTNSNSAKNTVVRHNVRVFADVQSFTLAGQPATLTKAAAAKVLTVDAGAFTLTGSSATLADTDRVAAEVGTFTLSGQPATLRQSYAIIAEVGSFAAAGQPATLRHNPRIEANTGSFALAGGAPALLRGRYLSGGSGTFTETGQPATLRRTWAIQGGTGAFALTGNPASLTELGAYEIDAVVGAFVLSGQPASLRQSRALTAEPGSFATTGQPAALRQAYQLSCAAGAFIATGQPATLAEQNAFGIEAGTGSFALSGSNAYLTQSQTLPVAAGLFVATGQPVTLIKASTARRRNVLIF
jgi:hypothetical protein